MLQDGVPCCSTSAYPGHVLGSGPGVEWEGRSQLPGASSEVNSGRKHRASPVLEIYLTLFLFTAIHRENCYRPASVMGEPMHSDVRWAAPASPHGSRGQLGLERAHPGPRFLSPLKAASSRLGLPKSFDWGTPRDREASLLKPHWSHTCLSSSDTPDTAVTYNRPHPEDKSLS